MGLMGPRDGLPLWVSNRLCVPIWDLGGPSQMGAILTSIDAHIGYFWDHVIANLTLGTCDENLGMF